MKRGGLRFTEEQLAALQARMGHIPDRPLVAPPQVPAQTGTPARSKYAAEKVERDGEKFDSKKEGRRWVELKMLETTGAITDLQRQVAFELAPAVRLAGEARMKPAIRYISDFTYKENGVLVIEDCKSDPTRRLPAYRMKKHLMATVLGLQIKEV